MAKFSENLTNEDGEIIGRIVDHRVDEKGLQYTFELDPEWAKKLGIPGENE